MPRKIFKVGVAIVVVASMFAATVRPSSALCYYNTPGNFCQCCGYGNGPGYHAPLVLGPPTYCEWFSYNAVRLPCPPGPPNYCDYCGYGATCGCGAGEQSLLEPSAAPVTESPGDSVPWSPPTR